MNTSITTTAAGTTLPTHMKNRGRGNKIMVGTVVKAKVGDLEEEIGEGFSRRLRKEMTGVVQEVVGKRSYSARFQYWLDK